MKRLLAIPGALCIALIGFSQVGEGDPHLDSQIIEEMATGGFVGMAAAVISGDELVWSSGYGYADLENRVPFTPKTLINIASITKTITGTCLMVLVEKQYVLLDFYANEIIPFDLPRDITLRQLATHTSGIHDRDDFYDVEAYINEGKERPPLGVFLMNYLSPDGKDFKEANFLEAEPGQRYEYSNIGAGLAGYVVECISGERLDNFSRKYIFEPLGMESTGWFMEDIDRNMHSLLYTKSGAEIIPFYDLATYPDGNLRTSVEDLSRFLICIANGGEYKGKRILNEITIKEMLNPQYKKGKAPENFNVDERNIGIFWDVSKNDKGETIIGQSGGDPGVGTMMYYNLDQGTGIILFANSEGSRESYTKIYDALWDHASRLK